jgi:hypothetical protein
MNRSRSNSKALAALVCLALLPSTLIAASAAAITVFHFTPESMSQYQRQLAAGQIHAATFNKVAHTLHLSMNDHNHFIVTYPPLQYRKIVAELEGKGVPVAVEKYHKAAAKPVHHKLRYIAGGIIIVVVVVVLLVLLVGRRRSLLESEGPGETGSEPAGSSPTDSG